MKDKNTGRVVFGEDGHVVDYDVATNRMVNRMAGVSVPRNEIKRLNTSNEWVESREGVESSKRENASETFTEPAKVLPVRCNCDVLVSIQMDFEIF